VQSQASGQELPLASLGLPHLQQKLLLASWGRRSFLVDFRRPLLASLGHPHSQLQRQLLVSVGHPYGQIQRLLLASLGHPHLPVQRPRQASGACQEVRPVCQGHQMQLRVCEECCWLDC